MKLRTFVSTLLVILFAVGIASDATAGSWRGWRRGCRGGWYGGCYSGYGRGYGRGWRHNAGEHNLPSTDFRTAHYKHG